MNEFVIKGPQDRINWLIVAALQGYGAYTTG